MKASPSYRSLNSRSAFAFERSLILPLALLATLLLGILFHCGYHFFHRLTFLKPFLPSAVGSLISPYHTAQLYVSSYNGIITTLNLKGRRLDTINTTKGCGGSPSWLTQHHGSVLFCLDEGLETSQGGLSSFRIGGDGLLEKLDGVATEFGPVSAVAFGAEGYGLALAHYGGSAFTTFSTEDPKSLSPLETFNFTLSRPGPNPSRQEAPHPHQAILDPTGNFVLVPDLGADLVRIYHVNQAKRTLTECDPLHAVPGSGPRHLGFVVHEDAMFMYLVTELGNTVVGYKVTYRKESMVFEQIWSSGIHGSGNDVPEGAAASEIIVSPDANFILISSRNESTLSFPNFDPTNRTIISSDPLLNFAVDRVTGYLSLLQEVPCGGKGPRQFSVNKAGSLVAVGLQNDGRVVIMERNVKTGMIGEIVAWAEIGGEVTAVIFNEEGT